MKLFLDDVRVPTGVERAWHNGRWEGFPSLYSWTIVRSYNQFVQAIKDNGLPTVISFDHDLSWEHYPKEGGPICENDPRLGKISIPYSQFKEKTGYHCAQWLVEYCLERDIPELPDFYVHSMNPVGRTNIISVLTSYSEIRKRYKDANTRTDSEDPKIIIP